MQQLAYTWGSLTTRLTVHANITFFLSLQSSQLSKHLHCMQLVCAFSMSTGRIQTVDCYHSPVHLPPTIISQPALHFPSVKSVAGELISGPRWDLLSHTKGLIMQGWNRVYIAHFQHSTIKLTFWPSTFPSLLLKDAAAPSVILAPSQSVSILIIFVQLQFCQIPRMEWHKIPSDFFPFTPVHPLTQAHVLHCSCLFQHITASCFHIRIIQSI